MTATDTAYRELLSEQLPRAIHSEREHRRYLARVEQLLDKEKRSAAEDRLLELLSILLERYEDEHQPIGAADPIVALKELTRAKACRRSN